MSVRRLNDVKRLARCVSKLRVGDVLVYAGWRVCLNAAGDAVWLECRGELWHVPNDADAGAALARVVRDRAPTQSPNS